MTQYRTLLTSPFARQRAKALIDKAPDGFVAEVREPKRSLEQNDRLWAMLSSIAASKPLGRSLTPDIWKCLLMDAFGRETNNGKFLSRWEPAIDGEGAVNVGHSSSRLSKAEMSEFQDWLQAFGDEHGVRWSDERKDAA